MLKQPSRKRLANKFLSHAWRRDERNLHFLIKLLWRFMCTVCLRCNRFMHFSISFFFIYCTLGSLTLFVQNKKNLGFYLICKQSKPHSKKKRTIFTRNWNSTLWLIALVIWLTLGDRQRKRERKWKIVNALAMLGWNANVGIAWWLFDVVMKFYEALWDLFCEICRALCIDTTRLIGLVIELRFFQFFF